MMQQQRHSTSSRSPLEWVLAWFNLILGAFLGGFTLTVLNRLTSDGSSLEEKLSILGFCVMTISLWSAAFFLIRRAYAFARIFELLASASGLVSVGAFAYYCGKQYTSRDLLFVALFGSLLLFACLLAWAARWLGQLAESER